MLDEHFAHAARQQVLFIVFCFFDIWWVSEMTQLLIILPNEPDVGHEGRQATLRYGLKYKITARELTLFLKFGSQFLWPWCVFFSFRSCRKEKRTFNFCYLSAMVEHVPDTAYGETDKSKLRFPLLMFRLFCFHSASQNVAIFSFI